MTGGDGSVGGWVGNDETLEGREGRKGVERRWAGEEGVKMLEMGGGEDGRVFEVLCMKDCQSVNPSALAKKVMEVNSL